jgi:hypothetical protein
VGRISPEKKMLKYFKIYEQICDDPLLSVYALSQKARISRNTVTAYLKEMYEKQVITGPFLSMKRAQKYTEYVYFMNFSDPMKIFEGLKEFPHIVYHALTFGSWNTSIISERPLDFSRLVGFETMVYRDEKVESELLKAQMISWDAVFREKNESIHKFSHRVKNQDVKEMPVLDWRRDEWALYHAFKHNMRQPVTPRLKKIQVRHEIFGKWKKTIREYCTMQVGFFPERKENYSVCTFLLSSNYEKEVKLLFSHFPTSSLYMDMREGMMVSVYVRDPDCMRKLFCMVCDMKTKGIIEKFRHAQLIDEYHHCK